MGIVLWAGILVVAFVLLLLAVDVTCYFVNKCGLIMCLCGKSATGTKGHNLEEGKAAFIKDESKEPIVEVRTEDECSANHNAAGPTEPNETTPLTEPELAAYTAALALDTLSSVATNSDTATATLDPAQDSPSSETTTLTCSLSTPANEPSEPSPTPLPAPAPTPESNAALPAPIISSSTIEAKMAPLVEQRGCDASGEQEEKTPPPVTPERTRPQKSGTPIPPKRRHSPKLAALHAKSSPPVSPLAASSPASSPSSETKKQAPSPPVTKLPAKPAPMVFDTGTPVQAGSRPSRPDSESHPAAPPPSEAHSVKNPGHQPDDDASTPKTAEESPLVAHVPSPLPINTINSVPAPALNDALTSNDFLAPLSDTYDLLTPEAGPKNADLELELTNGTGRASLIPEDLISLESPPSLPNGDGADLPLTGPVVEASKTLAKTAPPVNDEKIFSEEKDKLEEAELSKALTEIAAEHNSIIQTNTAVNKA